MLTQELSSRRIAACGIVLILVAGVTVYTKRTEGASSSAGPLPAATMPATGAIASAPAQGQGQSEFIQTIRVFVHPDDLYPGIVTVRPGKIRFVAENETQSDISVVVERVNPGQARQSVCRSKTVNHGKRDRQEVNLGAGEYVFYEESRPQQQGRIIVDPNIR